MARNDAASNVMRKKLIKNEKIEKGKEDQRAHLCFLYNDVERPLSLALQPGTTPLNIIRLVTDARDKLRIAMRKMGYQGQF